MWKLKVLILSIISLSVSANPTNENIKLGQIVETLSYRLPNNTVPKSYDIAIETKIHENIFEFSGNVKIHVEVVEPTDSITLHSRQLEIDRVGVFLPNSAPIILNVDFDHVESHDFLIIKLPRVYNASEQLLLDISYLGNLRDDNGGFYRSSYYNNDIMKWFAATQFQMDDARHAMPCFDEPGFRATMKLTLRHGSNFIAISNTEVIEVIPDGSFVTTKFAETPVMPTYLLAFVVSEFEQISPSNSRITQNLYGHPQLIQNGLLDYAASVVGKILDIYESFLPDYPLMKMDHVAVNYSKKPVMENFGLMTYDEYVIGLSPISPENINKATIETDSIVQRISNAFAMQWFGNTVSPKWWQHLWLSEGFGKFFEGYLQYRYYNDSNLMDKHFTSIMQEALMIDSWTDRTMNDYVEHPQELWTKFNPITVSKSACILRMIMEVMTEDVFLKGLNYYLTENSMQSVTPTELHNSLQKAYDENNTGSPLNIGIIMETWEDQAGYPLISIRVSGSNLIISQKRYYASTDETYAVPLTFATKSYPVFTTRTKTWLPLRTISVPQASLGFAPGDWIILNINQVGYYRVDYDLTLWHAIIDQLKADHTVINPINRESLQVEFYTAWIELERVNGGNALSLLSYLGEESNPAVWYQAYNSLDYLRTNLFGTAAYDEYLKLLQQISKPHLVRLGYNALSNDTTDDALLRSYTKEWNCIAIDGECVAKDLVQLMMLFLMGRGNGNFNFCNAMKIADNTTYSEILARVTTDRNLDYRSDYIWGLGCSIMAQNLNKSLEAILDNENALQRSERGFILETMASSSNLGLEMSLNFIDEHYLDILDILEFTIYPIHYIAIGVKDEELVPKFENLMTKLLAKGIINADDQRFYQGLINQNQFWLNKNYYDIKVFFGLEETTTTVPTTTTLIDTTTTTISEPSTTTSSSTISVPTTTISPTNPSTQPSSSLPTEPSTEPTTPGSGNSVIFSMNLIFGCLLINLMKLF